MGAEAEEGKRYQYFNLKVMVLCQMQFLGEVWIATCPKMRGHCKALEKQTVPRFQNLGQCKQNLQHRRNWQ